MKSSGKRRNCNTLGGNFTRAQNGGWTVVGENALINESFRGHLRYLLFSVTDTLQYNVSLYEILFFSKFIDIATKRPRNDVHANSILCEC